MKPGRGGGGNGGGGGHHKKRALKRNRKTLEGRKSNEIRILITENLTKQVPGGGKLLLMLFV